MKKVKLDVQSISQGTMSNHPFFLVLAEANGWRKMSVMIGPAEAQAILVAMRKVNTPRPLMPDVYVSTLARLGGCLNEVIIYKVVDGVYYAWLVLQHQGEIYEVDARTSDAIALALRCLAPIYTYEQLIEREHIREGKNGTISIPLSSVGVPVLREALDQAVREENYELAAQLRDEIARRSLRQGDDIE